MAELPEILIWGAGGHGAVVLDIVRREGKFAPIGWFDDVTPGRSGTEHLGLPVHTSDSEIAELMTGGLTHFIVAVGNCSARSRISERGVGLGLKLGTARHPLAAVADAAVVGHGSVIAAQSVVAPGARLGLNVIVNHGATVDHDCEIGDSVHICPGANIAGNVTVGSHSWIGIGASVRDRVRIGHDVTVGAGAAVVNDLESNVVAVGVPAKPVATPTCK